MGSCTAVLVIVVLLVAGGSVSILYSYLLKLICDQGYSMSKIMEHTHNTDYTEITALLKESVVCHALP